MYKFQKKINTCLYKKKKANAKQYGTHSQKTNFMNINQALEKKTPTQAWGVDGSTEWALC